MWKFARQQPLATLGGIIVVAAVVIALAAAWAAPYDPTKIEPAKLLVHPGKLHLLGTDYLGRDVLSRVIYGTRTSLLVGVGSVALGTLLATIVGAVSGYIGGNLDMITQRIVDALMSFPALVLILVIMSVIGPGIRNVILVLALLTMAGNSRLIRSAVMAIRDSEYVEACITIGCSHGRVLLRHVLPNIVPTIIVVWSINIPVAIVAEASISYLGFGIPPPQPSLGQMMSGQGQQVLLAAPWVALSAGAVLSLIVFGFNVLGDGLRDVLDPRLKRT